MEALLNAIPNHVTLDQKPLASNATGFAPVFGLHLQLAERLPDQKRREIACLWMIRIASNTKLARQAGKLWDILFNHLQDREKEVSPRLLKTFAHYTPYMTQKTWALSAIEDRHTRPPVGFGQFTPTFLHPPSHTQKGVT